MSVVKFPYDASRRAHARKPRRSKNGTPEERAARATAEIVTPASVLEMPKPAAAAPKAAPPKAATPRPMTYTTRQLMQALETLDGPDRRYVEGYIQGLVDARK